MSSWTEQIAVFDLETTGLDVTTSRIVTAHVGVLDGAGAVVTGQDWLLDPGIEIPQRASEVHGVTTERARAEGITAARGVAEIVAALREVLDRGLPLVVYNAPYDLSLLRHEAERHGVDPILTPATVIDPLVLDKAVDRYRRGKRTLAAAAEHYGVTLDAAHTAGADAVAAGRVAQALAARFPEELSAPADELHIRQVEWCRAQTARFEEYMRRTKDPTFTASGAWPLH